MPGTVTGSNPSALAALVESATSERDLLLETLLELKIMRLHLAEVSGEVFEQEDVELETN